MDPQALITQKGEDVSNLQSLIDSGQLNQWMYQLIRPYVKGKVLEIWSGEGNMSALLVQNGLPFRISDPHRHNCELLQKRFESEPIVKRVHRIDLYDPEFDTNYDNFLGKLDIVLSLNAIEKDTANPVILKNVKKLLWESGRLIMLLPAQTVLYEESAEGLEDLRRWNRQYIKDLLGKEAKILQFFTVSEKKRSTPIPLYNQQVPFFQATEETFSCRPGLYIIASARK
jgi:hypothetical protein